MPFKKYLQYLFYRFSLVLSPVLRKQRENTFSIPIIIINFNQLYYLHKQIEFYLARGFSNIIIIDNKSTFPPLLDYYQEIKSHITIEYMEENYGHLVFFQSEKLLKKYGKGYYVVTDADILPNEDLPLNFMDTMINLLSKHFEKVCKVGFALRIDDLPNFFPHKNKVLEWESRFWKNEIEKDCFYNILDTTFALYKPGYPRRYSSTDFLTAIRIGAKFTARHGGWYKDPNNLTQEEAYYEKHANTSASWKISNEHIKNWKISD